MRAARAYSAHSGLRVEQTFFAFMGDFAPSTELQCASVDAKCSKWHDSGD